MAKEQLATKAYLVRAGSFKDVDVALFAHVGDNLTVSRGGSSRNGMVFVEYLFKGESAHSAGAPWRSKSALDAVELMDVGIKELWDLGATMAQAATLMTGTTFTSRVLGSA